MVTKSKSAKKHVKLGKLKLNKETVKNLSETQTKAVKGGGGANVSVEKSVCACRGVD